MDKVIETLKNEIEKTKTRIGKIDWDKEFKNMIEDEDYTPLRFQHLSRHKKLIALYDPTDLFNTTRDRWRVIKDTKPEEAKVLEVEWREVMRLLKEMCDIEMKALTTAWDKVEDECDKPFLLCECGHFAYSEKNRNKDEHDCDLDDEDRTTECSICNQKCGTFERLDRHKKSKHHTKYRCKPCEFGTNSKPQYDRHLKCGDHKDKCGIVKPEFKCEICNNRVFPFKSLYEAHMVSPTHLKKIQQKM
jgi:hypothetical protein